MVRPDILLATPQDQRGSGPMADDRRAQDGRTGSDPGGPDTSGHTT